MIVHCAKKLKGGPIKNVLILFFFTSSYRTRSPYTAHFIMNLLDIIDEHLGEIDLWPSFILRYLFIDHHSPVRTDRPNEVIAFYGNDVPQVLACRFYNTCIGRASRFVAEQFHEWYYV